MSTPTEAINWLLSQKKTMGASAATANASAVRSLAGHIAEDEPHTVEWMIQNIGELQQRWNALSTERKPTTAAAYASRAKGSLDAFLRWRDNPNLGPTETWERRVRHGDGGTDRSIPLGAGRGAFHYAARTLEMRDVRRIALHLATLCDDYEPGEAST